MSFSIYVDGAAPNNQHGCTQGGIGIAAFNEHGELEYQDSITIRRSTTNAELELIALIEGLEYAQDGDVIYSDSDFCVKGYMICSSLSGADQGNPKTKNGPTHVRAILAQMPIHQIKTLSV